MLENDNISTFFYLSGCLSLSLLSLLSFLSSLLCLSPSLFLSPLNPAASIIYLGAIMTTPVRIPKILILKVQEGLSDIVQLSYLFVSLSIALRDMWP